MRRETQNLLLVLLGGALLKISFTGAYLRYVKPSLLPWTVGAGAVIVLLGALAIARDIRSGPVGSGHEHGSRSPWMLLLPVLAIFLVAPPALGSDAVERAGDRVVRPDRPSGESWFDPLPQRGTPLLTISEFVTRVVWDDSGALRGRAIRLHGFVVHPGGSPGAVQLARMRINCCAADAAPLRVDLAGPAAEQAARLPADTWIEVTGTLRPGTTAVDGQVPALDVRGVEQIPAPANPYEQ